MFRIPHMPEEKLRIRVGLHTGQSLDGDSYCKQREINREEDTKEGKWNVFNRLILILNRFTSILGQDIFSCQYLL